MNNYKWSYAEPSLPSALLSLNIDKDILDILVSRGISTEEEIYKFLNPSLDNISSPFDFADVEKAALKIISSIDSNKKICIYGDYDVDGITSVSLMVLALKKLGANVVYHIPLRDDGYGLNCEALQKIKREGSDLVITVDCGISSIREIEFASQIGLEIIVTDHHEITGELPAAFAVVNPKREDNISRFKYLAGVGISFMLLCSIYSILKREKEVFEFLEIVAIGTVADIVPLVEENRIFVHFGLKQLAFTSNRGLKAVISKLYGKDKTTFDSSDIGFKIAPLFNAAGRLEDANKAVMLLTTESQTEAEIIANELKLKNDERKEIQKTIYNMVENSVTSSMQDFEKSVIVADSSFHHGVIGIVASKIVDKYYKPAIIMEIKENGTAVASARSIANFNMIEALNSLKDLLVKYGGHEGAAGFTIETDKIEEFKLRFNNYITENYNDSIYEKEILISSDIIPPKLSFEFYTRISQLEPFGFANRKPIFSMKSVTVSNARLIGANKDHLMFDMIKDGYVIRNCAWFGKGFMLPELSKSSKYDIAFQLELSEFKCRYYVKAFIEDIKPTQEKDNRLKYFRDLRNLTFPMETQFFSNFIPDIADVTLDFDSEDNIKVVQQKRGIGFLSTEFSRVLRELLSFYSFRFKASVSSFQEKEDGYIVYLQIEKLLTFSSFSVKESSLFTDIKNFLIGEFEYNQLQKQVLSLYFKQKKNTAFISKKGRGVDTIFLTAAIYEMNITGKKSAFIYNNREEFSEFFLNYFDVFEEEPENISDYSFVGYFNKLPSLPVKKALLFSSVDITVTGFEKYFDNFSLPENIEFENKRTLEDINPVGYEVYSKYLPATEKKRFIKEYKNYEKIKASPEFMALI